MSDYLPQDLWQQIFVKLPVKPLLRCTAVCKDWCSIIKSPAFISEHRKASISHHPPLLLLRVSGRSNKAFYFVHSDDEQDFALQFHSELPFSRWRNLLLAGVSRRSNRELYSVHSDDDQDFAQQFHYELPFSGWRNLHLAGSVNGLICLTRDLDARSSGTDMTILWNPAVRKSVILPPPNVTRGCKAHVGFGYDSKTDDYKVVRIVDLVPLQDGGGGGPSILVEIFSLNWWSWKSTPAIGSEHQVTMEESGPQPFVNGIVHWIAQTRVITQNYWKLVLGFDVGNEIFHEILLPEHFDLDPIRILKYRDSSIAVFEDCLCSTGFIHVWVMREYGVVTSWTNLFSISAAEGLRRPLAFRATGELLMEGLVGEIVSYDPNDGRKKILVATSTKHFAFADNFVTNLGLMDNENALNDADVVNITRNAR